MIIAGFVHVRDVIGSPPIAPEGENDFGGRSPQYVRDGAYPLFWIRKACWSCHREFEGYGLLPQGDEDPRRLACCESCGNRIEAEARRIQAEQLAELIAEHRRGAKRDQGHTRRTRDPLDDD